MACERWREMLSAQLDGEDDPAERASVDEHLTKCADCREWLDRAAAVTRLTRTSVAVATPDLTAAIMAALPGAGEQADERIGEHAGASRWWRPARARLSSALYVALAGVGAVQLILGLDQVGGDGTGAHVHAGLDATPGHLWNESAAWNVAVGAGLLFIALRRNRPTGLVPVLTAFVGMLLLLSFNDLTAGRVDGARLVSHGFVVLGYILVMALSKVDGETVRPPGAGVGGGSGWRTYLAADDEVETAPFVPALRLVPRQPGPLTADGGRRAA